jgi:FecR protein
MHRSKRRLYSITSSARASSIGGTARSSALAVLRLMASSNLVAACTGRIDRRHVQRGFTDGTAFNISSNARMVLNEFVYDPNGTSNSTLFSLTKGTFTFIAGKVAKTGDMKIDTPAATMGIRGTTPHVEISDDGTVRFYTLIEENKDKVTEKRVEPVKQRQTTRGSSQPHASPRRQRSNVEGTLTTACR